MAIDNSIKTVNELADLIGQLVLLGKGGFGWNSIKPLVGIIADISEIMIDAKQSLPELQNLSPEEEIKLGQAFFESWKNLIKKL